MLEMYDYRPTYIHNIYDFLTWYILRKMYKNEDDRLVVRRRWSSLCSLRLGINNLSFDKSFAKQSTNGVSKALSVQVIWTRLKMMSISHSIHSFLSSKSFLQFSNHVINICVHILTHEYFSFRYFPFHSFWPIINNFLLGILPHDVKRDWFTPPERFHTQSH